MLQYLLPSVHVMLCSQNIKICSFLQTNSHHFFGVSIPLKPHYYIFKIDNASLLLLVWMQKSFQYNSGILRQTELVIFSQTASLLLMNAAGRVSVSPEEITGNTGNVCPLWKWARQQPRKNDRQTHILQRH